MSEKLQTSIIPNGTNIYPKDTVMTKQLEVLEQFKQMVEEGDINGLIITGVDTEKQIVLASFCEDVLSGIGILETGKYAFLRQQTEDE